VKIGNYEIVVKRITKFKGIQYLSKTKILRFLKEQLPDMRKEPKRLVQRITLDYQEGGEVVEVFV